MFWLQALCYDDGFTIITNLSNSILHLDKHHKLQILATDKVIMKNNTY